MEAKCITSPKLARKLLKKGFRIIDIKPDKRNKEATIFVFEKTPELDYFLEGYYSGRKITDG